MKTKLTIFCWLALTLLLSAADLSVPAESKQEAQKSSSAPLQEEAPVTDRNPPAQGQQESPVHFKKDIQAKDPKWSGQVQQKNSAQLKAEKTRAAAQASGYSAVDPNVDTSFPNVLADHNWQKAADVTWGNVIIIRRSTEEPDPTGKTVLMRWRTPSEMRRNDFVSSKSNTYDLRSKMREKQFANRQ